MYKYNTRELNQSKIKIDHSENVSTVHMKCNLYNHLGNVAGFALTENTYHKINNQYHVTARATYRIHKRGTFVVHVAYTSPIEFLIGKVIVKPVFANGMFNTNHTITVDAKPDGSRFLTIS